MAQRANSVRTHGNILNLTYEYVSYARTNLSGVDVYGEFLKQFCSEQLLCFLESFVPYEFTVLPSLKCLGRASFRLPLTNSITINPLLTNLFRSRWMDLGRFPFLILFMNLNFHHPQHPSSIKRKKRAQPISSHLDRESLVIKPYMYAFMKLKSRAKRAFFSRQKLSPKVTI